MNKKAKYIFCLLASMGIASVCYIFLHELGHMIVMLSAGAVIDDFSIIGAHVSAHGGEYTNISDLWLHANGAFLPLIIVYSCIPVTLFSPLLYSIVKVRKSTPPNRFFAQPV